MHSAPIENTTFDLSICIPTLNRAEYIAETLDSITSQLCPSVELVIVDGGSKDATESIVKAYQQNFPSIRYVKKDIQTNTPSNEGFDRDCAKAVELARGKYCWLMTDDDLIRPGGIKSVLAKIQEDFELIIVSTEIRNKDLSKILLGKRPSLKKDISFESTPTDWNQFAVYAGNHITFVGAVVIKRSVWLERAKDKFFGSGFVHVGVILQKRFSGRILLMSEPIVIIRYGNAHWTDRAFKIWMYDWPAMIWSFEDLSDAAKNKITSRYPWKENWILLRERVFGHYSLNNFNQYLRSAEYSGFSKKIAWIIANLPRKPLYYFGLVFVYVSARNIQLNKFRLREGWDKEHV